MGTVETNCSSYYEYGSNDLSKTISHLSENNTTHNHKEETIMTIAKNIEISSTSEKSFEDAIQTGIAKVTETVKNVQGAWINEQKVIIKENKIAEYRVNLKISFLVE